MYNLTSNYTNLSPKTKEPFFNNFQLFNLTFKTTIGCWKQQRQLAEVIERGPTVRSGHVVLVSHLPGGEHR